MLNIVKHLLPRSKLWRLPFGSKIRGLFEGLAGQGNDVKTFADQVLEDAFPGQTRALSEWESEFGLPSQGTVANRRLALGAEFQLTGGQDPTYIQNALRAAGFTDLFVHESWESEDPFVFRDPREYTDAILYGTSHCTGEDEFDEPLPGQPQCTTGLDSSEEVVFQHQCSDLIDSFPGYIVNEDLSGRAPPPIPSNPDTWHAFIYICGETFGEYVSIDFERLTELKRILLTVCPMQHWIVLMVRSELESLTFVPDHPFNPQASGSSVTTRAPEDDYMASWRFTSGGSTSRSFMFPVPSGAVGVTLTVSAVSQSGTSGDAVLWASGRSSGTDPWYGSDSAEPEYNKTVLSVATAIPASSHVLYTGNLAGLALTAGALCEIAIGRPSRISSPDPDDTLSDNLLLSSLRVDFT